MSEFYRHPPESWGYTYNQNSSYYFSHYEETFDGDSILINARLRERFKDFTDCDLWRICFGGLRLEMFEMERHGLRIEITAKMRDLKEIRKDIEEDKEMGIRR